MNENHQPVILVIFGAAGDLTWRKLGPAVYNLALDRWLPERFAVVGVDGKPMETVKFQERLRDGVDRFSRRGKADTGAWSTLAGGMQLISGDFKDPGTYSTLARVLADKEKSWGGLGERIFYLAVPPAVMRVVVEGLGKANLCLDRVHTRVVLEKPFGRDRQSARELNLFLSSTFDEPQIFRIDHYLGKETVQNILAFRFANGLFEPVWDRRYIDHVQITVAEQIGVEHRGGYYDHAGALRDMIQNHLLQILCLVAMEPMVSFDANEIRNKKVDVLRAVRPVPEDRVHEFAVRGQYGPGWMEGQRVAGYRAEPGVSPESVTETFAAVKLFLDNWRWQDVPFYLRTGKRLAAKSSEAVIQFRPVPHRSFPGSAAIDWQANRLVMRIQPREGISLRFQAKHPGPDLRLSPVDMSFSYQDTFHVSPPDAYETLLLDVMRADATLFMRADQVESAWSVIAPILEVWGAVQPVDLPDYAAGSWGPETAEALIARDGRSWVQPSAHDDHPPT